MRLDPFIRDYRFFMEGFVEALEAPSTHFYLDTSLLMWLIRLGARARAEFITWCNGRPANVRVPVWAAHELHRHVISGTVRSNLQKTVSETHAKYDEFMRLASERADEVVCRAKGYAGRDSYIGELEHSFARLSQLARIVSGDETQLQQATEEVIAFVNDHVLRSEIAPVIEKLSRTGEFRYSHLMPPGFQDKKEENRYGDVVLWEELLEDLLATGCDAEGQARHAILISRDTKTDWVSAAPVVRNLAGEPQKSNRDQELDVTLAHPLLVHEFAVRAGGNRLYIAHPGFLASALDYAARRQRLPSGVGHWLAASHRPDLLGRLAASVLVAPAPALAQDHPVIPIGDVTQPSASTFAAEREGLIMATVTDLMAPSVATEVRAYQEALPHEQPEIVSSWVAALQAESISPFRLGRIFAELALVAAAVPDQLPAILEQLSRQIDSGRLNRIVLAIVASTYFDRYGELRRRPHLGLGAIALGIETDTRLIPAFATLNGFLTAAGAMLPYMPGSGRRPVRFFVDIAEGVGSAPRAIRDIRVGEQSAFADPLALDNPRRLSTLLGREPNAGCTGMELRGLIAREYLVPPECLSADKDKRRLTWPAHAGLVTLDTESEGGLSSLAEENDSD